MNNMNLSRFKKKSFTLLLEDSLWKTINARRENTVDTVDTNYTCIVDNALEINFKISYYLINLVWFYFLAFITQM